MKKLSTEQFIIKAREKHGDKYDYSKVEYQNNTTNIIIICKEHGDFLQQPSNHLMGKGCKKCGGRTIENTEEFIDKSIELHGDKYDYSKVEYNRTNQKITIICKKHGEYQQYPMVHIRGNGGCKECKKTSLSLINTKTIDKFINDALLIHGNKYDYSKVNYKNNKTQIIIICKEHGEFLQQPNNHLTGSGCIKCSGTYKYSNEEFINKAIELHGDKYDYSKVDYLGMNVKITIICKKHGDFILYPIKYLHRKQECPKCLLIKKYSKVSISYLDFISKLYNIKINHGENSSEFKIPNSKFKADGYCEETNTIYEFHGTIYHGDPRCCNSLEYNYFGKNYGELYKKTLEREQLIRDLGYNLVVMWEHDWNNINKSIKILQRKFCSNR
jgi:hypothetical protein